MKFRDIFRQANAYAMQYGILFGILWIIGFLAFVYSLRFFYLQPIYLFCMIATPFVGWQFTRFYRRQTTGDGKLPFSIAYLFSMLLYLYASIILAGAAYLYFGFIDNGQFVDSYLVYLRQPEIQDVLNTPEMQQQIRSIMGDADINEVVETLRDLPLAVIVSNILDIHILLGLIISVPTALFNMRSRAKH